MIPPRKKLADPFQALKQVDDFAKPKLPPQNGLRFQPNRLFESVEEIEKWIKFSYPGKTVKLIRSWSVQSLACQIEIQNEPSTSKKK